MKAQRTIAKAVTKVKLKEQKSDFEYWQTQPAEKRLEALEEIRWEYHAWKDEPQPGFQRVLSVVKRQ
jgi:hypothetical protein